MDIPDPFPLRCIPVPPEVTTVAGCNCGGVEFHRVQSIYDPPGSGCSIWALPREDMLAAIDDANDRQQAFTDGLNARLRTEAGTHG